MKDIHDPLAFYQHHLKEKFAHLVSDYFDRLVRHSQIDINANAATIERMNIYDKRIKKYQSANSRWGGLKFVLILIALVTLLWPVLSLLVQFLREEQKVYFSPIIFAICYVVGIGAIIFIKKKINPMIRSLERILGDFKKSYDQEKKKAYGQMEGLNRLYEWNFIESLIQRVLPNIKLDPFFSQARLLDLKDHLGWSEYFSNNRSVLYCQSGEIEGNPFVLGEALNFVMGVKSYQGSLEISWQEMITYTDDRGKLRTRWVTRHETLYATLTKPAPEYYIDQFLLYGNDAAPDLSFTHKPSDFAQEEGRSYQQSLKKAISKLEKKTRELEGFTLMSNQEFDALFQATDRDNEIQFRLLFTPLAQAEMVKLLRDQKDSFGDNFSFKKRKQINAIYPKFKDQFSFLMPPKIFQHYDFFEARKFFNDHCNQYFRSFYFTFAPLLAIPLYQQHSAQAPMTYEKKIQELSFWEGEMAANLHGERYFIHPDSETKNILKAEMGSCSNGRQQVTITAYGFSTKSHLDFVQKRGGDGNIHNVPVKWIEYIPVKATSSLVMEIVKNEPRTEEKEGKILHLLDQCEGFRRAKILSKILQ